LAKGKTSSIMATQRITTNFSSQRVLVDRKSWLDGMYLAPMDYIKNQGFYAS